MEEAETKVPTVPPEVLTYLEKIFPDRLPTEIVSPDDLRILVGEQRVIRHLRAKVKEQREAQLGTAQD